MDSDDYHFRTHERPGSVTSDSQSLDTTTTPSSERAPRKYPPPERYTVGDEENDHGYFPPLNEGELTNYNNDEDVEKNGSRTNSMGSYTNNGAVDGVGLSRQPTRDEVMSRISKVTSNAYSDIVVTNTGHDNVKDDGSEFKEYDPDLVTWEGPDDPNHPRNWSVGKKWLMTSVVSLYTMVSPLSSSILSPAVPKISEDLGITDSTTQSLTVSIFILAWAICPLFMAPISELYGRQYVLNASIVLLLIFNIACAVAQNTAELIVFRFLAGMAGAPPISVGAGTLADMFADRERNTPLALYSLGPLIGPVMAPIIAGWAAEYLDWPWVFWILSIMNGVIAVYGLVFYRETFAPVLLKRKAKKLRKESGNANLHSVFELQEESLLRKLAVAVSRPIRMLCTHPIIFGLGLFMAFMYGFMYLLLVTFPDLWTQKYHYQVGIAGLMYLGLGIGFCFGLIVFTPLIQKTYLLLTKRNNDVPMPEYRIALVSPVALLMCIGLIWYGWSAEATIHWIMPCIGTGIFGFGLVPMFQSIQLYLIDMNPRYSASAVGAAAVFRSCFGFGFPLFGRAMYDKMGYGWANTMCGILAAVLGIPFPLLVFFYGKRVRHWVDSKIIKD